MYVQKQHVRQFAAETFPMLTTAYTEGLTGTKVLGILSLGEKSVELECKRGEERLMRRQFLELIQKLFDNALEKAQTHMKQS